MADATDRRTGIVTEVVAEVAVDPVEDPREATNIGAHGSGPTQYRQHVG